MRGAIREQQRSASSAATPASSEELKRWETCSDLSERVLVDKEEKSDGALQGCSCGEGSLPCCRASSALKIEAESGDEAQTDPEPCGCHSSTSIVNRVRKSTRGLTGFVFVAEFCQKPR